MTETKTTFTGNGTLGPVTSSGGWNYVQAGGTNADYGSGTLNVQVDMGQGFVTVQEITSSDNNYRVNVPQGKQIQVVLSGSSSPNLDVVLLH